MTLAQSKMFTQHNLQNDVMNNNLLQDASGPGLLQQLYGKPIQPQDAGAPGLLQQIYGKPIQPPTHSTVGRQVSTPITLNIHELLGSRQASPTLTLNLGEHRRLDRTQSEPARIPINVNSSRYKTELCRPFEENGTCNYGDKCQFAHGAHELRNLPRHPKYKTELCKTFHNTAFCPYGLRCHFVHNSDERQQFGRQFSNQSSPLSQSPTSSHASFFSEDSLSPDSSRTSPSPSFNLFAGYSINLDFRTSTV